jgi:hypothetical protein
MDHGRIFSAAALVASLLAGGCGQGGGASSADGRAPDAVIADFLEAVRAGDDKKSSELLTETARTRAAEKEMVVAPPGSDTASFKVLEMEIEGNEAQVGTDWTDLDADGQSRTDRIVWMLRKEPAGWRIHGMATRVLPDLPPVMLDFENPDEMLRKQHEAEQEIARREAQLQRQAQEPATAGDPAVR